MDDEVREFSTINIKPLADGEKFQFRLSPSSREKGISIVFEIPAQGIGLLLATLQSLQVKYNIPIPPSHRPKGRPALRIVREDE